MPEIKVKGMSCGHCAAAVTKALQGLPGVSEVQVDLASGRVTYQSATPVPQEELARVRVDVIGPLVQHPDEIVLRVDHRLCNLVHGSSRFIKHTNPPLCAE